MYILLEYWDGKKWGFAGTHTSEEFAWVSLGGDDRNYRTVDAEGNVLTDKSEEGESK